MNYESIRLTGSMIFVFSGVVGAGVKVKIGLKSNGSPERRVGFLLFWGCCVVSVRWQPRRRQRRLASDGWRKNCHYKQRRRLFRKQQGGAAVLQGAAVHLPLGAGTH